jgi:ABC-2 type transport system ATP-binding protein
MRRRLEIAVGIVHEPQILFPDEPTLGLDPQGRAGFWEYVRHLRESRGLTIFLTTHYLEEADQLSDRIAIIDHGSILKTGSPAALKRELGGDIVHVRPTRASAQLPDGLGELPGALSVEAEGVEGGYRVKVARSESLVPEVVRACDRAHIDLSAISTQKPSLDEVFLAITGREYREEADGHGNGSAHHPMPGGRGDR